MDDKLFLEHVNKRKRITYDTRHCEERSDVAIQTAFLLASAFQKTELLHGLPRRFAPRNDDRNSGSSLNLKNSVETTKTKKPLTTETQRKQKPFRQLLFSFLTFSVSLWLMVFVILDNCTRFTHWVRD